MKGFRIYQAFAATALFAVSLTACGGGGGGGTPAATGAAVSKGVITAKGSVVVNGVTFSTTGATIRVDDNPGLESDLKVGMVVTVRGSSDDAARTGNATEIEAHDVLQGPATVGAGNTITVMGQTVRIEDNVTRLNDDNTLKTFAQAQADGVFAGEVEVHGFLDDQGGIRATSILRKTEGQFEMKGFVVTAGSGTFTMSLTPDGANPITVTGSLPAGAVVGSIVEVKASGAPVGGAITATQVQLEDRLGNAGVKVEVEGIAVGTDMTNFTINGQRVITNSATLFEGGLKADLVAGVKVEAEGPLDASGAIVATKISFRSNIKIEAPVTAFTAGTSIALLGKTIAINPFTRIDGAVTTRAEVRAMLDRDGNLIATRIVARGPDSNNRAFIQGPVSSVSAPGMTILSVPVTTGAGTEFRISTDSTDVAVNSSTFFAAVKPGVTVIKARWRDFTGDTTAVLEQAEIQLGK